MEPGLFKETLLFRDMEADEIRAALQALRAEEKAYGKGEAILRAGMTTDRLGLVMKGSVTIESNDMWGNRTILSHVGPNQLFAETYALLEGEPLLVDVIANENCRVLFLQDARRGILTHGSAPWALKFAANLLLVSAHKNLALSGRSFHTAPKTIRGRVLSYLNALSLRQGTQVLDVPFDRQQLADYLNVERSALSKELGRMQREGLFTVRKNHFVLHGDPIAETQGEAMRP